MGRIHTSLKSGCLLRRPSYLPRPHEGYQRRRVIIDIHDIMRRMNRNKNLWIVRDMMPVKEAVEYLIEELFTPRDTLMLMDEVSKYIDKYQDYRDLFENDDYTILEIELETIQREIDDRIVVGLDDLEGSFRYVVTEWLGDTSLVVLVDPITPDQHEASKNYPYSTAFEPHRVSDIFGLL